jgi:hypothetical protein
MFYRPLILSYDTCTYGLILVLLWTYVVNEELNRREMITCPDNELSCILMRISFMRSWDRCYDFLNIFAEKISEKIGVFDSKQS